jgi:hypothetical protein
MITDQDGNYAGPIEDGGVVNNIPNADYNLLGERKSIYLPDDEGQTYTIRLKGTGEGTFTLKVEDIKGNETVAAEIFPNMPVSPKLLGDIQIQSNKSKLQLSE